MNKSRLLVGLLLVAFLMMCTPASHAQATNCQSPGSTINCNVIAVGSSAIFPSAAIAAVSGDPQRGSGPICGTNHWTGSATGRDPRKTLTGGNGIPDEPGSIWIAWDNSTNPTIICAYLSVDSLVGQRLFYGQGTGASGPNNNGVLLLPTNACSTAGAKKVAFLWDTAAGLPLAVYNALQGTTGAVCPAPAAAAPVHFTTASTDVAPADALFVGNQRVLGNNSNAVATFPGDSKTTMGFGQANGSCIANNSAINSSYETSNVANPYCYTYVAGQPDPISGTVIPASQVVDEGALSMLPLIGITHNAVNSGGFGDLFVNKGWNDVLSQNIAAGYAFSPYGTATLTRDLFIGSGASSIPVVPAHYLAREPMSGTYTTWEWQVVRNKESALSGGGLSQETNVCGPTQLGPGCPYRAQVTNPGDCPSQTSFLSQKVFPNTSTCSNYMSWGIGASFPALKTRVLGTGEMVKVLNVNSTAGGGAGSACTAAIFPGFPCITDTFGYAFWSLGTFGGVSNVRYLQLDSNDALYAGWSTTNGGNNGAFPTVDPNQGVNPTGLTAAGAGCQGYFNGDGGVTVQNFTCNSSWPYPTFSNIVSGNYRSWSINRVMWYLPAGVTTLNPVFTTAGLNPPGFWLSAADQAAPVVGVPAHGVIPDFLPFGYCANGAACPSGSAPTLTYPTQAFRAHYAVSGWGIGNANNGIGASGYTTASTAAENGGDVAGSIVGVEAEADSFGFFSSSFLSWVQ